MSRELTILVCGGRDYMNKSRVEQVLDNINTHGEVVRVISGGATGADMLAATWARSRNIKLTIHLPEWDKYGRGAAIVRNKEMAAEKPDLIVAFPGGRGTEHMCRVGTDAGIEVIKVDEKWDNLKL